MHKVFSNKKTTIMKQIVLFFAFVFVSFSLCFASKDKYVLDNDWTDNAFASATELNLNETDFSALDFTSLNSFAGSELSSYMSKRKGSNKNAFAAALIDFFLGGIGIHRMYLGSHPMMWFFYGVSCCGIFGLVPLVDFIVLIVAGVDHSLGQFCNNNRYFMWIK